MKFNSFLQNIKAFVTDPNDKFQVGHVRLVEDEEEFRNAFHRFPESDDVNSFSEHKLQYRGKVGLLVFVFGDDTATIDFEDGAFSRDYPFEAIAEQIDVLECNLEDPVSEEAIEQSGVVAQEKYGHLSFEEFSSLFREAFDVTHAEALSQINGNPGRRVELIALLQVALEMAVDGMVQKNWEQAADAVYMVQKY
ncbi:MAG: hypothetical protein SGBAC_013057, partial [Bacillariaceae sp.]